MGFDRDLGEATVDVINSLVLQLIDLNSSINELHHRLVMQGTYLQGIVDELRTLNFAAGRIEEHISYRP